jgi:hypothetical protein
MNTAQPLPEPQERAATLVFEDQLTDHEIAWQIGVCRMTLHRWKRRPGFIARLKELHVAMVQAERRQARLERRREARAAARLERERLAREAAQDALWLEQFRLPPSQRQRR